jgi:TRAP-type C4-dicarboxylate transport system substrate-binding protein
VVLRNEQRAARNAFNEAAKPIRAERAATVKAAVDKAVAEAKASGKDPVVAGRVANRQAMQATKPDFDAKMKAITDTRRDAMAAAKAKRAAAKP